MTESAVQGANAYTINSKCLHMKDAILFAAANEDVVVTDTQTGNLLRVLTPPMVQPQDRKDWENCRVVGMQHFGEKYLCVGYSNKSIVVFDLLLEQKDVSPVIAITKIQKKPIFLSHATVDRSNGLGVILIADKAGEVWASDLPKLNKTVKLLGHCASVLMDMTINRGCTKLVTADRDEKIRISNFPQTELIGTYCLGHDSVVTSIATLNPSSSLLQGREMLVSTGWDHKLLLWDMQTGAVLKECKFMSTENGGGENATRICDDGNASSGHGENHGDSVDSVHEEVEKTYDETAAGNFPMRIVTYNPCSDQKHERKSPLIAVLFKDTSYIKLFDMDLRMKESMTIWLEAPPSDLIFTDNGMLIILMPAPIFIAIVEISEFRPGATIYKDEGYDKDKLFREFRQYCRQKGDVDFTQNVGNVEEGGGLKKQTLDKRFLAEKVLARKGVAKRSKSRGGKRRRKDKQSELEKEEVDVKEDREGAKQ